jgi:hypothetical protein
MAILSPQFGTNGVLDLSLSSSFVSSVDGKPVGAAYAKYPENFAGPPVDERPLLVGSATGATSQGVRPSKR